MNEKILNAEEIERMWERRIKEFQKLKMETDAKRSQFYSWMSPVLKSFVTNATSSEACGSDQMLDDDVCMNEGWKMLQKNGLNTSFAKAQSPPAQGLAIKKCAGNFEQKDLLTGNFEQMDLLSGNLEQMDLLNPPSDLTAIRKVSSAGAEQLE